MDVSGSFSALLAAFQPPFRRKSLPSTLPATLQLSSSHRSVQPLLACSRTMKISDIDTNHVAHNFQLLCKHALGTHGSRKVTLLHGADWCKQELIAQLSYNWHDSKLRFQFSCSLRIDWFHCSKPSNKLDQGYCAMYSFSNQPVAVFYAPQT